METTIDRFGRVVIPKRVREDLGLKAGEPLVIEEQAEGILLKPAREDALEAQGAGLGVRRERRRRSG